MDDQILDIDRVCALEEAFQRNGWTEEEIASLSEDGTLARVRSAIGLHKESINAGDEPFVPDGWAIEVHSFFYRGSLEWDGVRTRLHYDPAQLEEGSIDGRDLRRKLEGVPAMNASVLDFLLAHPHLIPSSWKGALVHFWGTVYRDPSGFACVRHLRWNGDSWQWGKTWAGDEIGCFSPAALLDESTPEPEIELPMLPCVERFALGPELDLGEELPFFPPPARPSLEGPPEPPVEQLTLPFPSSRPSLAAPPALTVEDRQYRRAAPADPAMGDDAIAEFLQKVAFEWDDRVR